MPFAYLCWLLIKYVLPLAIAAAVCTGLIVKLPEDPPEPPRWEPPHTDWRTWTPPEGE